MAPSDGTTFSDGVFVHPVPLEVRTPNTWHHGTLTWGTHIFIWHPYMAPWHPHMAPSHGTFTLRSCMAPWHPDKAPIHGTMASSRGTLGHTCRTLRRHPSMAPHTWHMAPLHGTTPHDKVVAHLSPSAGALTSHQLCEYVQWGEGNSSFQMIVATHKLRTTKHKHEAQTLHSMLAFDSSTKLWTSAWLTAFLVPGRRRRWRWLVGKQAVFEIFSRDHQGWVLRN